MGCLALSEVTSSQHWTEALCVSLLLSNAQPCSIGLDWRLPRGRMGSNHDLQLSTRTKRSAEYGIQWLKSFLGLPGAGYGMPCAGGHFV